MFYSKKPATNFTKQRWVADAARSSTAATGGASPPISCRPPASTRWDALLRTERDDTQLRLGGNGIAGGAALDRRRRRALLRDGRARRCATADPDALFFGDRLPIYYDPVAVRAEARHVDAIAINYNVDSPDGWIAPYFFDGLRQLTGGKPVLISEWFFAAHENRTGNRNNGHLMTVETQAERAARRRRRGARTSPAIPEIVGHRTGSSITTIRSAAAPTARITISASSISTNQPYEAAGRGARRRQPRAAGDPRRARAPMPRAEPRDVRRARTPRIDPPHRSLVDWPKPAALLPPLKPAPRRGRLRRGLSRRGASRASRSRRSARITTISTCWPMTAPFRSSEAYRIELDVDAGAGPRRFTLYFMPPRTKARPDHPPMAAQLCAGAPAEHGDNGCAAVPGARGALFRRRPAAHRRRGAAAVVARSASTARRPAAASRSRSPPRPGTARAGCRCRDCRRPRLGRARGAGSEMRLGGASPDAFEARQEDAPHLGGTGCGARGDKSAAFQ